MQGESISVGITFDIHDDFDCSERIAAKYLVDIENGFAKLL